MRPINKAAPMRQSYKLNPYLFLAAPEWLEKIRVPKENPKSMCAAARTEFSFACILLAKRWETTFHALVMAIWSWLNN
jgi:hypothetical protein